MSDTPEEKRSFDRRDEDKTTHELMLEMFRSQQALSEALHGHILEEPKMLAKTIDEAIDRLVPNGDANGHKTYHQSVIEAVEAQRKAAEAQETFYVNLRQEAMRGGVLGLGKVALICFGLYVAFRFNYKGPLPW
jgi:hypothetical protein